VTKLLMLRSYNLKTKRKKMDRTNETMLVLDNDVIDHIINTYRTLALDFTGEDRDAWESVAEEIEEWRNGKVLF